jgi:hypothetical protein
MMFGFFKRALLSLLSSVQSSPTVSTMSSVHIDECFSSLLAPDLCTNTDAFLTVYRDGISQSRDSDRVAALTRFMVVSITGNKLTNTLYQHELLSVVVHDKEKNQNHNFFIERNAASRSPDLHVRASTSKSIGKSVGRKPASTTEVPLLKLNSYDKQTHEHASPTSSSSSSSVSLLPPSHLSTRTSQHSLHEMFTLSSTRVVHSSSTSLANVLVAEDRILGGGVFVKDSPKGKIVGGEIGQVIDEILPINLSLFELGILVDVIHNEAPNYSLLTQCYWFRTIIFNIILLLYRNGLEDAAGLGPEDYLARLGNRWNGNLVSVVTEEELNRVEESFKDRKRVEFLKVFY